MPDKPLIKIDFATIKYDKTTAVDSVSLAMTQGEISCLLGPSGCGKTTLLRAIAGFADLNQGSISLKGEIISSQSHTKAPEKRHIGMVFQDFALFPHLTLAQNISFGIKHLKKSKRESRTAEMLELVNMAYFSWRYPHELSGGQQQRAALARALAPKPDILLLDEPFSSMDVELRHELALELRLILKHENITALMVTHDQNEAFAISDNIGVMDNGKLLQWDNAYDLYHKPKTSFVANFIGEGVLIEGEVIAGNKVKTPLMILEGKTPPGSKSGDKVKVLIRPDDIVHDDCSPLSATIKNKMFRGSSYLYQLELDNGNELLSMVHSHHSHAVGSRLGIVMEMEHMVVFPDNSQP